MPQPTSTRSRARGKLRRVTALAVAMVAAAALPLLGSASAAHAAGRANSLPDGDPLGVTIDTLAPSTVPKKGPITVTGEITNDDTSTWSDINVYAFMGAIPMTTSTELSGSVAAAEEDPTAPLGDRITETGDYATIARLAPGASAAYTLTIPRKDLLVSAPGVYWFGVHALGTGPEGRDATADGRARTLLPLVPPLAKKAKPEKLALIVPIRAHVVRESDGRIANIASWTRLLATTGRLASALALGSSSQAITWLIDPAVLDALQQLAAGNPPTLPTSTAKAHPAGPLAVEAHAWLTSFEQYAPDNQLLALPYGDLDADGAATYATTLYAAARERGAAALAAAHLDAMPVDAPVTGYASPEALKLDAAVPTIVSDLAVDGVQAPSATIEGQPLFVTSSEAADGGPGPDDPRATVAMRQRLLAEAAVRSSTTQPLLVSLPPTWLTSDPAAFLDGLNVPWLTMTTVSSAMAGTKPERLAGNLLQYGTAQREEELPKSAFVAAQRLIHAGQIFQSVLDDGDVSTAVLDDALTTVSYEARHTRGRPAVLSRRAIVRALNSITMQVPLGVEMSSAKGSFSVTVVNGLPVPVTVQVDPFTMDSSTVTSPDPVRVPANGRSTVLLTAITHTNGVHIVHLRLTDAAGNRFSTPARVPVRSAQVGKVIWLFIAVGAGLLFVAIGLRLVRRIMRERQAKS